MALITSLGVDDMSEDAELPLAAPEPVTSTSTQGPSVGLEAPTQPEIKSGFEATSRPKTEFERKLGMANTIFQIAAITLGGCFALWKFGLEDRPTLQDHLRLSGSMSWTHQGDNSCVADVDIDATNLSKSNIEVNEVRGRAWLVDRPSPQQKEISHFDPEAEALKKDSIDSFDNFDGPLIQKYVPGQSSHNTFEWVVERKENSYAVFTIEVYRPRGKDPIDVQTQWDTACGEKPTDTVKKVSD